MKSHFSLIARESFVLGVFLLIFSDQKSFLRVSRMAGSRGVNEVVMLQTLVL